MPFSVFFFFCNLILFLIGERKACPEGRFLIFYSILLYFSLDILIWIRFTLYDQLLKKKTGLKSFFYKVVII